MSAANGFSIGEGQGHYVLGVAPVDIDAGAVLHPRDRRRGSQ